MDKKERAECLELPPFLSSYMQCQCGKHCLMVEKKISLEKASFSDQIHLLNPTIAFYFMMVVCCGWRGKIST